MGMTQLRLRDIPGVGERVYEKLVGYFGSEEEALRALLQGRVASIAEALSSTRRAVRLVQLARGALAGYDPGEVIGSPDTPELFEAATKLFIESVASEPGKDLVATLAPVPGRFETEVKAVSRRMRRLVDATAAARITWPRLYGNLSRIAWPRKPRVKLNRVVVAPRDYAEKLRGKLDSSMEGLTIVEANSLDDVDVHSSAIILAYRVDVPDRPGVVWIDKLNTYTIVPELVIETLRRNKRVIEAFINIYEMDPGLLVSVAEALGKQPGIVDEIAALAREALGVLRRLELGEIDPEYKYASFVLKNLEPAVSDLEVWINEEAKQRLEERELRLSAAELLRLIQAFEKGHFRIPDELVEIFEEVSIEAENRLAEMLRLKPEEQEFIRGIVEPRPQFPLEVRREPIEKLRQHLEQKIGLSLYLFARKYAVRLSRLVELLPSTAEILAWLDVAQAAYRFIVEKHGCIAEVSRSFSGVGFIEAVEANLLPAGVKVQRVSYVAGCTPYRPEGTQCERVILLTGANSGGKTTLLKTIGEIVLASQAGLPVPASRAWVGGFDKVYYISKPAGMLDAGGLEGTLRKLAAIVEEAQRKRILLLVDELEAITEAHAAARIVAAIAASIARSKDSVAVIVSHLAEEVVEALPPAIRGQVRIDGIEAKGLDENYNLIVDRSPRYNYLARSTPELIVTKLLKKSKKSSERKFFETVLDLLSR